MAECSKCHMPDAYIGFHMNVECVNLQCTAFSAKWFAEKLSEKLRVGLEKRLAAHPVQPQDTEQNRQSQFIFPDGTLPPSNTP
jgi:hypothetical protein